MSEVINTRQAKRISLSISLQVTGLDSANTTFTDTMRTENVSKIGAFLRTDRLVPLGAVLKLESTKMKSNGGEEVLAKVVSIMAKKRIGGIGIKIIKGQDTWKHIITSL